jgi:hypothetical protein
MNIIKTTGIGVILILLCAVCSEPNDHNVPKHNYKSLSVIAEVSETEIPVKVAENYQIELFGNAMSCNLSQNGAPCISVSGVITETDGTGNFNFRDGELTLESTTTNCKLWGQFDGKGSLIGDSFVINSDVEVACGTGLFESYGGQLKMTISGLLPSGENPKPIYELTLNGLLEI